MVTHHPTAAALPAALADLAVRALSGAPLSALYDETVELLPRALDAEGCAIYERLPGGATLLLGSANGGCGGESPAREIALDSPSPQARAFSEKRTVLTSRKGCLAEASLAPSECEAGSGVCVPIPGDSGLSRGVLCVHRGAARGFSEEELRFLQDVARLLGAAAGRPRAAPSPERLRERFEIDIAGDFLADPDGRILSCNPAFAEIFAFPSAERAIGTSLAALEPLPGCWKELRDRVARDGIVRRHACELRRRDGQAVFVVVNAVAHLDAAGRLAEIAGAIVDRTDQKLLEDQFRQAQKMEAVGRLAGGVAHDFNNLLTAILGYGGLLREKLEGDRENLVDLDEILKAGERAAVLTRQLLAFSRKQVLHPEVLDAGEVLRGLQGMLRRIIGENIVLTLVPESTPGWVHADRGQLEQVILNLVVNSRDAMPDGGRLTIETATAELDAARVLDHPGAAPGLYVVLSVTDTGHGMDKETLSHLFEPFFTTKPQGKGTGLGLSTVYGIVHQSGGLIDVFSEPGHGASFRIGLPLVPALGQMRERPTSIRRMNGTETVLLVEDEPGVRALARRVLISLGYSVISAADGDHALRAWTADHGNVDLLLTDIIMPGLNGRELARQLSELGMTCPVLFTSGHPQDEILRNGVMEGSFAFLQKPFTPIALALKVREVLDGRGQPKAVQSNDT
ncbi:MAG: response regulator [Planctomycetes bacterium]|nr:response regulator [Planctomycetota bacterium]